MGNISKKNEQLTKELKPGYFRSRLGSCLAESHATSQRSNMAAKQRRFCKDGLDLAPCLPEEEECELLSMDRLFGMLNL